MTTRNLPTCTQTEVPASSQGRVVALPSGLQRTYGVLVADDEAEVREVLNDGMLREGFSTWVAADGQEAVELYRRHGETIDVALLDVLMPGLDGPQTLAALKTLNPDILCCFMSGCLGNHTEAELRRLGAATVFAKPFRVPQVAQALRTLAEARIPARPPVRRGNRAAPKAITKKGWDLDVRIAGSSGSGTSNTTEAHGPRKARDFKH